MLYDPKQFCNIYNVLLFFIVSYHVFFLLFSLIFHNAL